MLTSGPSQINITDFTEFNTALFLSGMGIRLSGNRTRRSITRYVVVQHSKKRVVGTVEYDKQTDFYEVNIFGTGDLKQGCKDWNSVYQLVQNWSPR